MPETTTLIKVHYISDTSNDMFQVGEIDGGILDKEIRDFLHMCPDSGHERLRSKVASIMQRIDSIALEEGIIDIKKQLSR